MSDDRKIELTFRTTPAELRLIASYLEDSKCDKVRVNWYHTRLVFELDETKELKNDEKCDLCEGNHLTSKHKWV